MLGPDSNSRAIRVPSSSLVIAYTTHSGTEGEAHAGVRFDYALCWIFISPLTFQIPKAFLRWDKGDKVLIRQEMANGVDGEGVEGLLRVYSAERLLRM